jgi:hypothetical protein
VPSYPMLISEQGAAFACRDDPALAPTAFGHAAIPDCVIDGHSSKEGCKQQPSGGRFYLATTSEQLSVDGRWRRVGTA